MHKLALNQKLKQKLLPQQIQFVKLLQTTGPDLEKRIAKELEENPALERTEEETNETTPAPIIKQERYNTKRALTPAASSGAEDLLANQSWREQLARQVALLPLDKEEQIIARYVLASIEPDGYLRRDPEILAEELSLLYHRPPDLPKVERIIQQIQKLDPPGTASRTLQEYLLLQLQNHPHHAASLAYQLIAHHFQPLVKKNYQAILSQLPISRQALRDALDLLSSLQPQPIPYTLLPGSAPLLQPDFTVTHEQGKLTVTLIKSYKKALATRQQYKELLQHSKDKAPTPDPQAFHFIQHNLNRAKWFIRAIEQREQTLLKIMEAIVTLQRPFFEEREEKRLLPLLLRDIADLIGMDLSTVSRAVRDKVVQTEWGIYPLKYFFSESIPTTTGKEISSRVVKKAIAALITEEDKQNPYTDEEIAHHLKTSGYLIARRTAAKYRQQLRFPVARLRKRLI